ncbi:MAG: group 1 glycosyl transferase [Parcubacteria group bacterium Athens0714_16]|nr:MAG: group 1 glycosyl transferase [Parcubacteria group bacterium Athens0714_16]
MKTLFLIFHGRFPSEKAASIFTAENCSAFANLGWSVVLLVPRRLGRFKGDPFSYYSVPNNFSIKYLPTVDLFSFSKKIAFVISFITFSIGVFFYLLKKAKKENLIYSNETLPLFISSFIFKNTFYEMHDFPESNFWFHKLLVKKVKWILIHNKWKINEAVKKFGVSKNKILYQPNVVNIKMFDIDISKENAREKLNLPKDKKNVIYTGHLYGWKGADVLADSAKYLDNSFLVVFVGGTPNDVKDFKKKYIESKNILFTGHREHKEIPIWQKSADILVLPNTAKEKISKYYTSPMKLFEYMASRRAIIASDIPSIREVTDNNMVYFVEPDNPLKLSNGIKDLVKNVSLQNKLSQNAYNHVMNQTWDKRAKTITEFINQ